MKNLMSLSEFVTEARAIQDIIKDLARHLSHDKDVIKYLNTSRSKRELGWREFLDSKLHGDSKEYINYITKSMVADFNPSNITGPVTIKNEEPSDFDDPEEVEIGRFDQITGTDDKLDDLNRRLEDVENTLGIDPDDEKSLEKAQKKAEKLGFDVIEDEDEDEKPEKDTEEEE